MVEICTHNLITGSLAFVAIGMSCVAFYFTFRTRKIIREAEQLRRDFEQTALHNYGITQEELDAAAGVPQRYPPTPPYLN